MQRLPGPAKCTSQDPGRHRPSATCELAWHELVLFWKSIIGPNRAAGGKIIILSRVPLLCIQSIDIGSVLCNMRVVQYAW